MHIVSALSTLVPELNLSEGIHVQAAVEWLLDGFNATLLAVGQSGTGKSTTLLGAQSDTVQPLLPAMLHSLFGSGTSAQCRISLSCWEVVQHQLVDLLTDGAHQQLASQVGQIAPAQHECLRSCCHAHILHQGITAKLYSIRV